MSTPGAPLGEASSADASRLADLEICLIAAARAIDVDLTPSDLSVSESGVKSAFEVRDAVRVLDRFSVAAWFGEAPLDQIDELVLPAVLMLEDGRAIAVLARSVGAPSQASMPNSPACASVIRVRYIQPKMPLQPWPTACQ